MITRIPQREQTDCATCVVAMVISALPGDAYNYDRVVQHSARYPKISSDGKFFSWWETYFADEGLDCCYCAFRGLYALPQYGGSIVGLLGMDIPHLRMGHIVAVDEIGVVDPAENAPPHVSLSDYISSRLPDGVIFHPQWLAVRKRA